MPGEQRSVAEILLDADITARTLMHDLGPGRAEALVRTWPALIAGAQAFFNSLPTAASLGSHGRGPVVDAGKQFRQIAWETDVLTRGRSGSGNQATSWAAWPPRGQLDERVVRAGQDLMAAADLIGRLAHRHHATRSWTREQNTDMNAACAQVMHTLYVTAHATARCCQDYAGQQQRHPGPQQLHQQRMATRAAARLATCELAAEPAAPRTRPAPTRAPHPAGPGTARLADAVAGWGRAVDHLEDGRVTAGQAKWAAYVQTHVATNTAILQGARQPNDHEQSTPVHDALTASHARWKRTVRALDGVTDDADQPPQDLTRAGNELIAAMRAAAWDGNAPATPRVIAARVDPTDAVRVLQVAGAHGQRVAAALQAAASDQRIVAHARPVHRAAQARARKVTPNQDAGPVVPLAATRKNTYVPLPAPLAAGVATHARLTHDAATAASSSLARTLPVTGRGEAIAATLGTDSPAARAVHARQLERILTAINPTDTKTPNQPLPALAVGQAPSKTSQDKPDSAERVRRARQRLRENDTDQTRQRRDEPRHQPGRSGPTLR